MERITQYFEALQHALQQNRWVIHEELTLRQIDDAEGYIKGVLHLYGGYALHVAEYVILRAGRPERLKYRYQLLDRANQLLTRWDNAPHHPQIETHPFHKHTRNGEITTSPAMDIPAILDELDTELEW